MLVRLRSTEGRRGCSSASQFSSCCIARGPEKGGSARTRSAGSRLSHVLVMTRVRGTTSDRQQAVRDTTPRRQALCSPVSPAVMVTRALLKRVMSPSQVRHRSSSGAWYLLVSCQVPCRIGRRLYSADSHSVAAFPAGLLFLRAAILITSSRDTLPVHVQQLGDAAMSPRACNTVP